MTEGSGTVWSWKLSKPTRFGFGADGVPLPSAAGIVKIADSPIAVWPAVNAASACAQVVSVPPLLSHARMMKRPRALGSAAPSGTPATVTVKEVQKPRSEAVVPATRNSAVAFGSFDLSFKI